MNLSSSSYKRKFRYQYLLWLRHDLPAGLTVFLVALPLCLGIALASGAPPHAGILSGIVGGLIVSMVSGSQLGVSGPAAGLTSVVAISIAGFGDFRVFLLAVFFAGIFQLLFGLLKLGTVANYFPSAVIKGMLAAIGIILISKQIPMALGYDQPDFWTEGFINLFNTNDFYMHLSNFYHHFSISVFTLSVISLVMLGYCAPLFKSKLKWLPLPLVIVIFGVSMNVFLLAYVPEWALKPTQIVNIPANIFGGIVVPDLSGVWSHPQVFKDGFTISLLASLETLLCVEAIDKLDPQKRKTPINKELVAQGLGNMACGLIGALPITAVIVRGAANVDAGGRTRLSAFTHGWFLLFAVLMIPSLLNRIPFASLAAILLVTGYNLAKPSLFRQMFRLGWNQFLPFIITIFTILATDLLEGVAIGLAISVYFLVRNNFKAEYVIEGHRALETEHYYIKLNSMVTFLNKVNLQKALYQAPAYSVLTIDGTGSRFIDYDVLEMISEFEKHAHDKHIQLVLKNVERVNVTALH